MVISKKGEANSEGKSVRPIIEFYDSKKVDEIPNEIFLFVIIVIWPTLIYLKY